MYLSGEGLSEMMMMRWGGGTLFQLIRKAKFVFFRITKTMQLVMVGHRGEIDWNFTGVKDSFSCSLFYSCCTLKL